MKRFWLPLCLALLVFIMGGLGIYRETTTRLSHAMARFKTALPADASFTYGTVEPALLIGGVTFRNVSFHYHDTSFTARLLRFGYPKLLPDGTLSLASLSLTDPNYNDPTHHLSAERVTFLHLFVPSSVEALRESRDEPDSMRSLAAIMSFEPRDVTALRFSRMHLINASLTTPDTPDDQTTQPFTLRSVKANSLTLEGYGKGTHVAGAVEGLHLSFKMTGDGVRTLPTLVGGLLLPRATAASILSVNLALQHLEARQGLIQWLKRPFRDGIDFSGQFWADPAKSLWEQPGKLNLVGLSLLLDNHSTRKYIALNHLFSQRWADKDDLRSRSNIEGLTAQLIPLNGASPSNNQGPNPPSDFQLTTFAKRVDGGWQENAQIRALSSAGNEILFNADLTFPNVNPLHFNSEETDQFAQEGQISQATLTLHDTDFLAYCGFLNPIPMNPIPTEDIANIDPAIAAAAKANIKQTRTATSHFSTLALKRPILSPAIDFLSSPTNRSLIVKSGSLTFSKLGHISVNGPDEAIFDGLHIYNISTKDTPTP